MNELMLVVEIIDCLFALIIAAVVISSIMAVSMPQICHCDHSFIHRSSFMTLLLSGATRPQRTCPRVLLTTTPSHNHPPSDPSSNHPQPHPHHHDAQPTHNTQQQQSNQRGHGMCMKGSAEAKAHDPHTRLHKVHTLVAHGRAS